MATAYYNENCKQAAGWLRSLIEAGLIMRGHVDDRSIVDVQPEDLKGFTRCHFFAGIGGWDYALQLAGWSDDRPVWTGSCPCVKVSGAQTYEPLQDPSECWPNFLRLIKAENPPVVFGEQSASPDGYTWLDGVFDGLEGNNYTCWASSLCAAGVGAPHVRQRNFWLGHANREGLEGHAGDADIQPEPRWLDPKADGPDPKAGVHDHWSNWRLVIRSEPAKSLADRAVEKRSRIQPGTFPVVAGLSDNLERLRSIEQQALSEVGAYASKAKINTNEAMSMVWREVQPQEGGKEKGVGVRVQLHEEEVLQPFMLCLSAARRASEDSSGFKEASPEVRWALLRGVRADQGVGCPPFGSQPNEQRQGEFADSVQILSRLLASHAGAYRDAARRAHAASCRAGLLRGYGNAIVPQVGAAFVGAYLDTCNNLGI